MTAPRDRACIKRPGHLFIDMSSSLSALRKSKFLRFGLPLIAFVVVGSVGLSEFTSIRVRKRDEKNRSLTAAEALQFQKKVGRVDVEEEFGSIQEKVDIHHWDNKRGPRPWEQPPAN